MKVLIFLGTPSNWYLSCKAVKEMIVHRPYVQSKSLKIWIEKIKTDFSLMGERKEHEPVSIILNFLRNSEANITSRYHLLNMGDALCNTVFVLFALCFSVSATYLILKGLVNKSHRLPGFSSRGRVTGTRCVVKGQQRTESCTLVMSQMVLTQHPVTIRNHWFRPMVHVLLHKWRLWGLGSRAPGMGRPTVAPVGAEGHAG